MAYTTADYVYDKVGITVNEIDPTQMSRILEQADAEVDRIMNTTSNPKTTIACFTAFCFLCFNSIFFINQNCCRCFIHNA